MGNKGDCYTEEEVSEKDARDFALKEKALFAITSAKTGDGIDKLFENACGMYLDPNFLKKINNMTVDRYRTMSFRLNKQEQKAKGGCCSNK